MDEVRNEPGIDPKMRAWHFDDLPVCANEPAPCEGNHCAHARIPEAIKNLQSSDPQRQLFGLRVLVHLVGDVHQPLHASDHHDHGGNNTLISNRSCFNNNSRGACKLHQYWDSVLVKKAMHRASETEYAKTVLAKMPLPANDSQNPNDWIRQSNQLGREVAYGKLPDFACSIGESGGLTTTVTPEYDRAAVATIEQQLAFAGQRLANVLNRIFK
jgi:hypothetical protein